MQHSYPNRCQDGNLVDPFDVPSAQLPAPAGDTDAEEGRRFSVREAEAKGDGVIQRSGTVQRNSEMLETAVMV